jgi:hypothetical protein
MEGTETCLEFPLLNVDEAGFFHGLALQAVLDHSEGSSNLAESDQYINLDMNRRKWDGPLPRPVRRTAPIAPSSTPPAPSHHRSACKPKPRSSRAIYQTPINTQLFPSPCLTAQPNLPTRLQRLIRLLEERRPVRDTPDHVANMDVVECSLLGCPRLGAVVDLEEDVRRHPGWLDRGDVGADDFAVGVGIGKVAAGCYRGDAWGAGRGGFSHRPLA